MTTRRFLNILTDCTDVASHEIRYSIIKHLENKDLASCIEPVVGIAEMSLVNGAFLNRLIAEACPDESILYTVLNPRARSASARRGHHREEEPCLRWAQHGCF